VTPHLYYHVVIRSELAASSFLQAMLSNRLPHLRTFVHTLVVPRIRYTWYHGIALEKDETYQTRFETEGYYPDGPYNTQIDQILGWLNDPTCRQSWQNLLVHRCFLVNTACQLPQQLTIVGAGESRWISLGVSNVRRLRLLDQMLLFSEAHLMPTRFSGLTHLGMVVYMEPSAARGIVDILLQSRTLEKLAVVIVPRPSAKSRVAGPGPMANAIYRELLKVDDERLVILERETSLLWMLRQPDGDPFWQRVDEIADDVKKNGKTRPSSLL
jgi:hypothetical protein